MMRLIIPILLLVVGLGGGVGAGLMLAGGDSEEPAEVAADAEDYGSDAEEVHDEHGEEDHAEVRDPPSVEAAGENTEFVRLNNQFVVPIVREGTVRSLVVMGLTIEAETGQSTFVFSQEPRLRDTFLRVMFAHANTGGFDGLFTEAAAMAPLREALLEAAQGALGASIVYDVLITDITRQDA